MDMKEYIKTEGRDAAKHLASRVGTKYVYLSQIASGFRKPSNILAVAIERETEGRITRRELRPDLYAKSSAA